VIPSSSFVELDKHIHDRKAFDCAVEELNNFLQQFAVRHRGANISKTMVLPSAENAANICAYYTLSHTEINRQTLPQNLAKKLPRYPIPVMLIAQLAVHKEVSGSGLGKVTLVRALQHAYHVNLHLPSYAVVVDALNNGVQAFYERYEFKPLYTHHQRTRLFLPMKKLAQLFVE
jgi:GNAT superfamily N-acetyltransferase